MVKTEDIMNTLFKAKESQVELFAETLVDATAMDNQSVDGEQLDKVFSFGLMLTDCEKCREKHWFVAFAELGTPLLQAVPPEQVVELIPALSFEDAITTYKDLNNELPRH